MYSHYSPRESKKPPKLEGAEKEEHEKRYFMGSYGTFGMDTIHGRLFELQVYVESLNYHIFLCFAFTLIALVLWPIAALLAIPLAYMPGPEPGRQDKDMAMFKVILVLATIIGIGLWSCPIIIISLGGGIDHFHKLILAKEMNFLDFLDFLLSELMVLLTIVFAWVYHEISITTAKYKESACESWKQRDGEFGLDLQFTKQQYERLLGVLKDNVGEKEISAFTHKVSEDAGVINIQDIVEILEVLPGWNGDMDHQTLVDHLYDKTGEATGLFAELAKVSNEAKEKNIWPIDVWLVREQYYPKTYLDVNVGLYVAYKNTIDLWVIVWKYFALRPVQAGLVIFLALTRSILPRFWLHFVLEGKMWPSDTFGAGGRLVAYSTVLTFFVSLVWLGVFWFVLMEYRRNLCQCMIISSIVDARSRVKFSQSYLMSCLWFGMDSDQSEAVLSKMPLLDMRISSNVAAFWRLRDYCTLDRSNERMGMSVLLSIVIIWLLLKFLLTMATMYVSGGLPAILIVTLFDLVVFGIMLIVALQAALAMNSMMDQHKQVFVEAKYEVTMAHGKHSRITGYAGEADEKAGDLQKHKDNAHHDLELCRRLLTEYLDLCNEYDARDTILFGMEVTPGKIVSSAGTMALAVMTLLQKMIANGAVDPPDVLEERLKQQARKQVALAAVHTTAKIAHSGAKFLAGKFA